MSHWRWRLWIQADLPPSEEEKPFVITPWTAPAFDYLRKNPNAMPMRLMVHLRIGYVRAERLIEDFKKYAR